MEAIVGLCVGVVARYIVPDSPGIGSDTLMGIVGGGLGGFIYKLFNHQVPFDQFNLWSIACAAIGAFALVLVTRATAGRRTIA